MLKIIFNKKWESWWLKVDEANITRVLMNYQFHILGYEIEYNGNTKVIPHNTLVKLILTNKIKLKGTNDALAAETRIRDAARDKPHKTVQTFEYVDNAILHNLYLNSGSLEFKRVNSVNNARLKATTLGLRVIELPNGKIAIIDEFNVITIMYEEEKIYLITISNHNVATVHFNEIFTDKRFDKLDTSGLDFSLISEAKYTFFDIIVKQFTLGNQNGTNIMDMTGLFCNFKSKQLDIRGLSVEAVSDTFRMFNGTTVDRLDISKDSFNTLKGIRDTFKNTNIEAIFDE